LPIFQKNDKLKAPLNSESNLYRQLQGMSDEFIELSNTAQDNIDAEEREKLLELADEKSIVISKADKGNAVVIQNTTDYKKKINELLNTSGKFALLDENPTRMRETRLPCYLRSLHAEHNTKHVPREHRIPDDVYKKVQPCGSRAGVLYGLPKIHKAGSP